MGSHHRKTAGGVADLRSGDLITVKNLLIECPFRFVKNVLLDISCNFINVV